MRNLPTRDFYEGELRALIIKLIEAYNKEKKAESPKFNLSMNARTLMFCRRCWKRLSVVVRSKGSNPE